MIHNILRGGLVALTGVVGIALVAFLYLLSYAVFFMMIGFIIYFFLAMAGVAPPVDYIPIIPYV